MLCQDYDAAAPRKELGKTKVRRLFLTAAVTMTLGSTFVAGCAADAASAPTTFPAGSKWTIKSEGQGGGSAPCPIREIFGSPGHFTWVPLGPPRFPGTYKTSGKTISEKAPGHIPGPIVFRGTWSKAQNRYNGTLTNGVNHFAATLAPGVVKSCPA